MLRRRAHSFSRDSTPTRHVVHCATLPSTTLPGAKYGTASGLHADAPAYLDTSCGSNPIWVSTYTLLLVRSSTKSCSLHAQLDSLTGPPQAAPPTGALYRNGVTAPRALPSESRSARDSGAPRAGCGLVHAAASMSGSPSAFTPFLTCRDSARLVTACTAVCLHAPQRLAPASPTRLS